MSFFHSYLGNQGIAAPRDKALGKYLFGLQFSGNPITTELVNTKATLVGATPNIIGFYKGFENLTNPQGDFQAVKVRQSFQVCKHFNAIPMLTLEAFYFPSATATYISLEEYKTGNYYPYIQALADIIREFGQPVIIRHCHEANLKNQTGNSYLWAENDWANADSDTPARTAELYNLIAYDLRRACKAEGVEDLVKFYWCPNNENVAIGVSGDTSWNRLENYWPGGEYVDYVGLDGYSGSSYAGYRTMQQINETTTGHGQAVYDLIRSLSDKPYIIGETNWAESPDPSATDWRNWSIDAMNYTEDKDLLSICFFTNEAKGHNMLSDFHSDIATNYTANGELHKFFPELKTAVFA